MGCKFGKENSKPTNDSSPQAKKSTVSRSKDYNHSSSAVNASEKTAKYQTKIDRRVTSKYDIKALIGKGSFSEVLRVDCKLSKQPFAIKLLKIQTDIEKQLSTSELSALAKISHHFIVKLEEVIISKSVIYLVMQLATGGELYDRIKSKGHFDEKYSCNITQMLLDAIFYLHLNGIIHRDLKPENILFYHPGGDSKILITDFGFAKVKTGIGGDYASTWCGTPEYVGPELVQRLPYDYKVDVWALGVIVYIMLSGHLPFSAPTSAKLFNLIVNGSYSYKKPIWVSISDSAKDFINKLLVIDPLSRLDADGASHHSWVRSYPPLHKSKDHSIINKFSTSLKRQQIVNSERIVDVPYIIDMTGIANNNVLHNKEFKNVRNNDAFQNSNFSMNVSGTIKLNKIDNGLILPVTGEFQGNIISKEKILEENTSTFSPSNVDSLTMEDSNSTPSNLANFYQYNKSTEIEFVDGKPFSPKGLEEMYFPLKLNEKNKRSAHEGFVIIDENSEDEPIYNVLPEPFKTRGAGSSPQNMTEPNLRTRYIEKVGVWLNDSTDGIQETCFIDGNSSQSPNTSESFVTVEKTISAHTNYYSAHSSFDRFLLPSIPRNHQEVNIPLKPLRRPPGSLSKNIHHDDAG